MRMKLRSIAGLLALVSILSACGANRQAEEHAAAPEPQPEAAAQSEPKTDAPPPAAAEPEEPASAPAPAEPEDAPFLLHPLIETKNRSYYEDGESMTELVSCAWSCITLDEDEAARFPELARSLRAEFSDEEQWYAEAELSLEDAAEYIAARDDMWYYGGFDFSRTIEMERSDSSVFSYTVLDYQFTGGAHGSYGTAGYSFDTRTGQKIGVRDAFTDPDRLAGLVCDTLIAAYSPDAFFNSPDELLATIQEQIREDSLIFVLTNTGARVIFNPYDVAPYASGTLTAEILFAWEPDLFDPAYTEFPDSYIMKMGDRTVYADLDGDGSPESVSLDAHYNYEDDFSHIDMLTVYAGDEIVAYEVGVFEIEPYLVKQGDHIYVYALSTVENDYRLLIVFDLTGGKPHVTTKDAWLNLSPACREYWYDDFNTDDSIWEGSSVNHTLTDPGQMVLESRTDLLSTVAGFRTCRAGENGIPVPWEGHEAYQINNQYFTFTAKQDVAGVSIAGDGSEAGPGMIHAGQTVRYAGTDNASYADLLKEDGETVRVKVTNGWPRTVDGTDIEEAFDGIIFAG